MDVVAKVGDDRSPWDGLLLMYVTTATCTAQNSKSHDQQDFSQN